MASSVAALNALQGAGLDQDTVFTPAVEADLPSTSVLFGGIMLSLGHILMAVEGHAAKFYAAGTTLAEDLMLKSGEVIAAGTVLAEDITMRDTAALKVFYLALALIG